MCLFLQCKIYTPIFSEPWVKLKKIRQSIGSKCSWLEEKSHPSLLDNVKWLTEILKPQARRSQTQEQPIRKQVFYTAGHLHLEASVKYISLVEPQIVHFPETPQAIFPLFNILEPLPNRKKKGKTDCYS